MPISIATPEDLDRVNVVAAQGPPEPEFDKTSKRLLSPISTIGNTLLFRQHFAKNTGEKLHVFRNGAYRDDGDYVIREASRELLQKWGAVSQWKKRIAGEVQEWITLASPTLWDRPPLDRINLQNGILDLKTGELQLHTPEWLSPIQLPIFFDATADCPQWDKFFQSVLPADVWEAQVPYQLLALLMIPYTAAQRAVLLRGPRGTGKSRVLESVRLFLGAHNTSSKSLHTLEENRFARPYLYSKLANICADLPSRDLESTSIFKGITGEDVIEGEYKFGLHFEFKPFSRLLFSANQAPQSKDASDAFLDRWWVIPIEKRFQDSENQMPAEQIHALLSQQRELSGVLNRALKWLPHVLQKHGIDQTESMRVAHDDFCAVTDPFRVWLTEYISDDPDKVATCDETLSSYLAFLRERGKPPITSKAFGSSFASISVVSIPNNEPYSAVRGRRGVTSASA